MLIVPIVIMNLLVSLSNSVDVNRLNFMTYHQLVHYKYWMMCLIRLGSEPGIF